jgi:branched-chain amino acid transport system ATP-binding protein
MVEHDMELVMGVCHRVNVLDFGVKIAEGPPDEVRANPQVQAAYLGADNDEARIQELTSDELAGRP